MTTSTLQTRSPLVAISPRYEPADARPGPMHHREDDEGGGKVGGGG